MKVLSTFAAASCLLTGCATVMNDSTHAMKVDVKTLDGEVVAGADCKLSNDRGAVPVKSGDTARVHRSGQDLDITCSRPESPPAKGRVISRANSGMWGNIIIGGGIGAVIDHNRGTAYTYPSWVQLVFGKTLVFDRRAETEGQPVLGAEAVASK